VRANDEVSEDAPEELGAQPQPRSVSDVRRLYEKHAAELRLALHRLTGSGADADDLLQEAFVIALRRMGELSHVRSERGWLYGVSLKLVAAWRRRKRLRAWLGLDSALELAAPDSPQRTLEQREAGKQLQVALEALPEAKRDVIVLFELQGLSGDEIAEAMRVPVATVWTRLFHARKALAKALGPPGGDSDG
jgi:RNA polymerase sigma-70 factor, ECF subfamily